MNFQSMNKQRKFVLIAAAIGVIAMFLPWFKIELFGFSQSINGFHSWGILVFFCFAGAGVITLLGDQTKYLEKTFWFVTIVCGAIATLLMIITFIRANNSGFSFLSYGFYFALLAAIGVLACTYLFRNPNDNIKDGFESLKKEIEEKTKSVNNP